MQKPFKWDYYSDQPYPIQDKSYKKNQQKKHILNYLSMFAIFSVITPIALLQQLFLRNKKICCQIGVGVNLDKGEQQFALIEELGVQHLIIRIPLWEIEKIDEYVNFIKNFNNKNILVNILQDRKNIENHSLLKYNINIIFTKLLNIVNEYQIGNAINRSKWGFFSVNEYLSFYQVIQNIRDTNFKNIKLIGPSVIDFEYYYTTSALFNFKNIKFDKLSALLYVDRRGSPYNTQYKFFHTKNKIKLLYSLTKLSNKTNNEIYITEVNWPRSNTAPYAPTSEYECVDEQTYSKYMIDYLKIAKNSNKIKRVYWHQLIAPGYGLIDNRNKKIKKTSAFYAFKQIINENY